MKTVLIIVALFLNMSCAKVPASDQPSAAISPEKEVQHELPAQFTGSLNYKEITLNVADVFTSCLPAGCSLGGIGKDTIVRYNSKTCIFNTELITNYRTNYYYLTISARVEDIPNYNYQPNPSECSELIGDFWIHHTTVDNSFNATFEKL